MPLIRLTVDGLSVKDLRKLVRRRARDHGLRVEDAAADADFRLREGNLAASIFLGAFIRYIDAAVAIDPARRGRTKVVIEIEWSTPWWTGLIGVRRTSGALKSLTDDLQDDIRDADGDTLTRVG